MEHQNVKSEILKINNELLSIILKAKMFPFLETSLLNELEKRCRNIETQIKEEIFRIAIVGAIKSGKSTLSNYLCQGDYLRRGAGIITSFITKVRRGKDLRAIIKLKGWKEINREMDLAVRELSLYKKELEDVLPFDLRDNNKREQLRKIIKGLDTEVIIKEGYHDLNYTVLSLYLKGYEKLKELVSEGSKELIYKGKRFKEHEKFVGEDSYAVYLKDVLIEVNTGVFDEAIEIADCQGSDSPNPTHLMMIQEYLTLSHLVIYVISSRMGLREADIKFLQVIKKMGMMNNVVFVLNCDFDEHSSLEDMLRVLNKTKEELSIFVDSPKIFAFSALFNLLNEIEKIENKELTKKEITRLAQWRNENELVEFSNNETRRFLEHLSSVTKQKYQHALRVWLDRLFFIGSSLLEWISISKNVILGNKAKADELIKKVNEQKESLNKIIPVMEATLKGATSKLKEEIKKQIDKFFQKEGRIISSLTHFIEGFSIPYERYLEIIQYSNLSQSQYMIFRQYKEAVDSFIVQEINPQIVHFVKELDKKIESSFVSIVEPYWKMICKALDKDYNSDLSLDLYQVKEAHKIHPPSVKSALEYNKMLGTETVVRFGVYRFLDFLIGIIRKKKKKPDPIKEKVMVLEKGLKKIKEQSKDSILFAFLNYKENLKYQYAFALIDICEKQLVETMKEFLKKEAKEFSEIEERVKKESFDRESVLSELTNMEQNLNELIITLKNWELLEA